MDINDLRSIVTVLTAVVFGGIVWWAYSDHRKKPYEEAARSVLEDDTPPSTERGAGQTNH